MLTFKDFQIITIDQDYVKCLHDACSEVFYQPQDYENKPYLGILINQNERKYAIPFTSAKQKHLSLKNYVNGNVLVSEIITINDVKSTMVVSENADGTYMHLLAVLCLSKMIPVRDDIFSVVDINYDINDTPDIKNYKVLLNKEFSFCVSNKDKICKEAAKIYDRQLKTNKVYFKYVDFKKLEATCDTYHN